VTILRISSWKVEEIADLYRDGGWWDEDWDPSHLNKLIAGSFRFIIAVDGATGKAIGMGRVISDGISDAYIQDLVVEPSFQGRGIGGCILDRILEECLEAGIGWIGCIAEPGTDGFYRGAGFAPMKGHIPLLYAKRRP
jgi:GNAT superfamily N-acetyltransferase